MSNSEDTSGISIDWRRFWDVLFRVVTGIGLSAFWLFLVAGTIGILAWGGIFVSGLSFAWLLGLGVVIPVLLVVWWLCFYVALDALSDIGIKLKGKWSLIIIPVGPLLAPIAFGFVYLSGLGRMVTKPNSVVLAFGAGALLLLFLVCGLAFG